jgi:DNA-binding NarL/FixJ family response regulator
MEKMAILVSSDLLLASQIDGDCRAVGLTLVTADASNCLDRAANAEWVFWDLQAAMPSSDVVEQFHAQVGCRIIALGPHVDEERLQSARDAGCDLVLPRGQFVRELSQILRNDQHGS